MPKLNIDQIQFCIMETLFVTKRILIIFSYYRQVFVPVTPEDDRVVSETLSSYV